MNETDVNENRQTDDEDVMPGQEPSPQTVVTNDKRTTTSIVILMVLIVIALTSYVFYKSQYKVTTQTEQHVVEKPTNGTNTFCGKYTDDAKAYADAMENKSLDYCECINDTQTKETCFGVVKELNIYDQALTQADPQLCENIKESTRRDACVEVAQSKIDYLKKQDPQALADIQSLSHSEQVIGTLEELLKTDGENIKNLTQLALSYAEKGLKEQEQGGNQSVDVQKAIQTIEKAKELDPNNSEVYRVEGYIYEIQPDISKSILSYNKAIELNPQNADAYAGRGHANRILGALNKAVEDFEKAKEIDSNRQNIFIYTNLCTLYKSKGEINNALENCSIVTKAENVDPVFQSESCQVLASIYIEKGQYEKSEMYLSKASTLTPNDANLYIEISKLNIKQKQYEIAVENANKAIALSPKKAVAFLTLSQALYMQGKYQDAIDASQKGLEMVDDDVSLLISGKNSVKQSLYNSIADCYKELGDTEKNKEFRELANMVI